MLLAVYGQLDERFPKLCRGVKKWNADTGMEEQVAAFKQESTERCWTPIGQANLYVTRGEISVLMMVHKTTCVDVDVTIDNDPSETNTMLLSVYGQPDERSPKLCRGVKKRAPETEVEIFKMGRANCFSICLLLVHLLQQVAAQEVALDYRDGANSARGTRFQTREYRKMLDS
uniref:PITH domain-containing protein n=1 Tax=Caenorhabditis tropicalis TaxID=1561998 RepID=A0A1I7TJ91_9PELO